MSATRTTVARSIVPYMAWADFLPEFSRSHRGWRTVIETFDKETQETVSSQEMMLDSIELDLEDEPNPRINVTVHIGNKASKHILFRPTQMVLRTSSGGRDSLEIEAIHTRTKIRLGDTHGSED